MRYADIFAGKTPIQKENSNLTTDMHTQALAWEAGGTEMQPRDQEKMWGDPRSGPFFWRVYSLSEPLVLDSSRRGCAVSLLARSPFLICSESNDLAVSEFFLKVTTIKEKDTMNLKHSKGDGYVEGLEEREGKEQRCNCIIFSKNKHYFSEMSG